jgi:Uncharacterized alpha/beta hydrolase domain (DUF2235)
MKKLAIFLDGTFNTLNNNTNVWRLRSLTAQTPDQRVYYSQGVGTKRGEVARGGVAGYGLDDEIIEAYTWLIENFDDGDEIFIFGFSRGAYTARSLSGLVSKCGILKLGAPLSIEQLYTRYRLYVAPTIRSLLAKPLPQDASLEEQWLTKYSRPQDPLHRRLGHRRFDGHPAHQRRSQGPQVPVPRYAPASRQRIRFPRTGPRRAP